MQITIGDLMDMTIEAKDGGIGKPEEFLFDDQSWIIRYCVADTGSWLQTRKVLLSPQAVEVDMDESEGLIRVDLTREQIEKSPGIERHEPVSRQKEIILHRYYGWVPYFPFGGVHGYAIASPMIPVTEQRKDVSKDENLDPNLRSTEEVRGYHISAVDGEVGHVSDFLIQSEDWSVRDLVVETRNWLPGKHVLIATQQIDAVVWDDRKVHVNLTKEQIRESQTAEGRARYLKTLGKATP